jgi:hypothetical protein
MNQIQRILVLVVVVFLSSEVMAQAVPPPIPPPPPPGLTLGIGEYFFLIAGLAFGVRHIKKEDDQTSSPK